MTLKDKIFSFFGSYDKHLDIHKDSDDKGTLERFNETLAEDMDTTILMQVDSILENVILPSHCGEDYLAILEKGKGNTILELDDALVVRRQIQRQIQRYHEIKGSVHSYKLMFRMIGFDVTITEEFTTKNWDSTETLDSDSRTFDSDCEICSCYNLDLNRIDGSASDVTPKEQIAIDSIIKFNEPVNATICQLSFNGDEIMVSEGDYNFDFSTDYY